MTKKQAKSNLPVRPLGYWTWRAIPLADPRWRKTLIDNPILLQWLKSDESRNDTEIAKMKELSLAESVKEDVVEEPTE